MFVFFFLKKKTAYEMRISDWSSDVCSSDLETNAVLGLALLDIESDGHRAMVSRIQNELFDLGADLATPYVAGEAEGAALRITPAQSTRLETEMDEMNEHLEPLRDRKSVV